MSPGLRVHLIHGPADDLADMVSHLYIESFADRRRRIANDYLEASCLNVHGSSGCLVDPVMAPVNPE